MDTSPLTPFLRWDGLHLVLNLKMVERYLQRQLGSLEWLGDVELVGAGDAIQVRVTMVWRGVRARAAVDLAEIRLRQRRLGLRLRHTRAPGRVPVPRAALEKALSVIDSELLTVIRGHGILVVDLRQWIPPEVVLSVRAVQATSTYLHIWLGPGSVRDLPGQETMRLQSG